MIIEDCTFNVIAGTEYPPRIEKLKIGDRVKITTPNGSRTIRVSKIRSWQDHENRCIRAEVTATLFKAKK